MARFLCISPCPPSMSIPPIATNGITFPMGIKVKPVMSFNVKANCDTCEATSLMLAQVQPLFQSFQFPLCLLNCIKTIIDSSQDQKPDPKDSTKMLPPSVLYAFNKLFSGLPMPDLTPPLKSLIYAAMQCSSCITGWGPMAFCLMAKGFLELIIAALNCIRDIFKKFITLKLQVAGLEGDPSIEIRKTAVCLDKLITIQKGTVTVKMNMLAAIIKAMTFIFEAMPLVTPSPAILLSQITISLASVNSLVGGDTIVAMLDKILPLLKSLHGVVEGICPG